MKVLDRFGKELEVGNVVLFTTMEITGRLRAYIDRGRIIKIRHERKSVFCVEIAKGKSIRTERFNRDIVKYTDK